jgi:hypothetical protein
VTRWAEREKRREGQVCREVYLSKEVVEQEKDASEGQEDTQHHSNTRATCRHAALLEEALIRRAGGEHHLPSPPPSTHKSTRLPRAHAHIQAHTYAYAYGARGHAKGASPPPTHTHRCFEVWFEIRAQG